MAEVTVEGTLTPSVYLAKGARARVELTDAVRRKVKRGYIKIVEHHGTVGQATVEVTADTAALQDDLRTATEREADEQAEASRQELGVPSRGASRVDWATYLLERGIITQDQHDDTEVGRNDLLAIWDAYEA